MSTKIKTFKIQKENNSRLAIPFQKFLQPATIISRWQMERFPRETRLRVAPYPIRMLKYLPRKQLFIGKYCLVKLSSILRESKPRPPPPPFFFSLKNSSQNPQSSFPSYKKYFIRHDKMITKQNYGRVWRTDKKRISKRHKEKKYMRRREYRSDPCYLWYLRCTRATRLSRPQWKFDWRVHET